MADEEYDPIRALEDVVAGAKEVDAAQVPVFALEKILTQVRGLGLPDGQYFLNLGKQENPDIIQVTRGEGTLFNTLSPYVPEPGDELVRAVPYDDVEKAREATLAEVRVWLKSTTGSAGFESSFNARFPKN